jgi:hypothetical protein
MFALAGPYLGILLHRAVRAVVAPADLSAGFLTFLRTEHLLSSSSATGPVTTGSPARPGSAGGRHGDSRAGGAGRAGLLRERRSPPAKWQCDSRAGEAGRARLLHAHQGRPGDTSAPRL